MMSFHENRLAETQLPLGTVWLLEKLAESKGKQSLYEKQSPQILGALREMALVESTESSNRIEGVTVERERLRPLILGNARPRDRSEEEIVGYRRALSWIHTNHEKVTIEPDTLKRLHALAQGGTTGDAGEWKRTANEIIELHPDGHREVCFRPVEPDKVPAAIRAVSRISSRDRSAESHASSGNRLPRSRLSLCSSVPGRQRACVAFTHLVGPLPPRTSGGSLYQP